MGYKLSQQTKDQMSASHRARLEAQRPVRLFAKKIADAAGRGDMGQIYEILDTFVAAQGHTLTDEEITAMMKVMLNRLKDKDAAIRSLSEEGDYGRMLRNPSPAERASLQKRIIAMNERRR